MRASIAGGKAAVWGRGKQAVRQRRPHTVAINVPHGADTVGVMSGPRGQKVQKSGWERERERERGRERDGDKEIQMKSRRHFACFH